jgi:hypothetical protein
MDPDSDYTFNDYELDNAEFFSKNQEEPFLYKINNVFYPNPEFLSCHLPDDISSYRVNLCIFYIENLCVLPFVKFALLKNETNKTVEFMEFDTGNIDNDNLEQTVISQFQHLFDSSLENPNAADSYKGFITKQDDIYMFFDITSLLTKHKRLSRKFIYGVAHELCELGAVVDYEIGQNIRNLFDVDEDVFPKCAILQPWFYNLDGMLQNIEIPKIAYICLTDKKGNLRNLTSDDLHDVFVPADCLVDYDDCGFLYYFSEKVMDPIENSYYFRFVVFLMNMESTNNSNTISTQFRKMQIWGVKSIDQFIPV